MADVNLTSLIFWNDAAATPPIVLAGRGEQQRLAAAAARACRASQKAEFFNNQFQRLLSTLRDWLDGHRTKVRAAYLTVRDRDLLFLCVQKEARFDPELTDSLTELDLHIANDPEFELIDLEVMAVPPLSAESLQAVLASGTVVYDAQ